MTSVTVGCLMVRDRKSGLPCVAYDVVAWVGEREGPEGRISADIPRGERAEEASREHVELWHEYETKLCLPDGRLLECGISSRLISFNGAARILSVPSEVTTRKRAEAAHLAALVQFCDDAIIAKDLDGVITVWNLGAEKVFGFPAVEMVGTTGLRLLPPDREDEEFHVIGKILSGECGGHFETVRKTREGRLINVSMTFSPIRDADGIIVGVSKVARDITSRKRMEAESLQREAELHDDRNLLRTLIDSLPDVSFTTDLQGRPGISNAAHGPLALRDSEERFRTMADSMPHLSWIAGPDGEIFWYNQRWYEYTGTTPEQMEGWGWKSVPDPGALPAVLQRWIGAIHTGERFEMDFPLRGKDGNFRTFLTRVEPRKDAAGRVVNWFGTHTDVEVLKQAAGEQIQRLNSDLEQRVRDRTAELEAANRELEAFSYSVSHDLRAPLRHILGFVNLLQKNAGPALSQTSQRFLTTISEAAARMGQLIDDMLAFSRVGRSAMQMTEVNLNQLVHEALVDLQGETRERNIVWEIHDLPEVQADRALLRLVMVNLISNAVKFTRTRVQARIEIGCSPGGDDDIIVFIRDNGAGFDPRYADKLFGVFQRLHSQFEFEGTGIGLANVQRIILRHGGRVWAEGAVDAGATFFFSIPNPEGGPHGH